VLKGGVEKELFCFCIEMADAAGLMEAAGARFSSLELIGRGSFGDVYKA
jgi:hypothetical protein